MNTVVENSSSGFGELQGGKTGRGTQGQERPLVRGNGQTKKNENALKLFWG